MDEYTVAATNAIERYMEKKGIEPMVDTHYSAMIDAFGLFTDEKKPVPQLPYTKNILLLSAITKEDGTFLIEETVETQKYMRYVNKSQLAV